MNSFLHGNNCLLPRHVRFEYLPPLWFYRFCLIRQNMLHYIIVMLVSCFGHCSGATDASHTHRQLDSFFNSVFRLTNKKHRSCTPLAIFEGLSWVIMNPPHNDQIARTSSGSAKESRPDVFNFLVGIITKSAIFYLFGILVSCLDTQAKQTDSLTSYMTGVQWQNRQLARQTCQQIRHPGQQ